MKKTTLKSLLALAMVFVLAFTAVIPAMAYSITINPGDETNMTPTDRFSAYQIFTGTVDDPDVLKGDDYKNNRLASVKWGTGIVEADILAALQKVTTVINVVNGEEGATETFGNLVKAAVNGMQDKAAAVARLLNDYANDSTFVQEFAKAVAGYVTEKGIKEAKKSDVKKVEGKDAFVIEGLDAGYYLVIDTYVTGQGTDKNPDGTDDKYDARSAYILEVVNDKTVIVKSSVPTVDKEIVKADGNTADAAVAGIGEHVKFRLTGTLPENLDLYKANGVKYTYKFIDTLSAGLTYDEGSYKVYVQNYKLQDGELVKDGGRVEFNQLNFNSAAATAPATGTILTFTSSDLLGAASSAGITIDKNSEIIIEYTATVNENAVIYDKDANPKSNPNKVKLEYSNDPYVEGKTGETTEEIVYVYVLDIDVNKTDSKNNPLAGAKFKLYYKDADDNKHYANLVAGDTDNSYVLRDGLLDEGESTAIPSWTVNATAADGTVITTDSTGKFTVAGLQAGKYYLEETEAPAGYNKMADIEITISVTFDETDTTTIKSVTVRSTGTRDLDDVSVNETTNEITLKNYLGAELPSTGGIGTTIFYVLGGVILAAAVVFFAITRKKASAQKQ